VAGSLSGSIAGEAGVVACESDLGRSLATHLRAPLPHLGLPMSLGAVSFRFLVLGDLGVVLVQRLPRCTGLVDVLGFDTSRDILSNVLELHMDPVSLAMGVRTQFLFRRQRHLGGAVSLAHRLPPASWSPTVVSVAV
jgi:hypothetical protein